MTPPRPLCQSLPANPPLRDWSFDPARRQGTFALAGFDSRFAINAWGLTLFAPYASFKGHTRHRFPDPSARKKIDLEGFIGQVAHQSLREHTPYAFLVDRRECQWGSAFILPHKKPHQYKIQLPFWRSSAFHDFLTLKLGARYQPVTGIYFLSSFDLKTLLFMFDPLMKPRTRLLDQSILLAFFNERFERLFQPEKQQSQGMINPLYTIT